MNFEIAPKETEIQANWVDARFYCFSLNIDGKVGWRLPTKEELNAIYQSENDFMEYWYWSSTEYNGGFVWKECPMDNEYIWCQSFNAGNQGGNLKVNRDYFVRAVRSL